MAPLPTVAQIKSAITAANRARRDAQDARDAGALAGAIQQQLTAKRRAGAALLEADVDSPLAAKLGEKTAQVCRALARLSDSEFRAKVEAVARRAAALVTPHGGGAGRQTRMALSPWIRTSDVALTRTLTAVDDEGAEVDADQKPSMGRSA